MTIVRSVSSCSIVPNRPDGTQDRRASTFSVRTPLRWILSRLILTVPAIILLVRIDGDVVHPHGVLLRRRRCVRRTHGIAVVENFAFGCSPPIAQRASADWSLQSSHANRCQRRPEPMPAARPIKMPRRLIARLQFLMRGCPPSRLKARRKRVAEAVGFAKRDIIRRDQTRGGGRGGFWPGASRR